jgi:hypothetical protein
MVRGELYQSVMRYWPSEFNLQGSSLDEESDSFISPALSSAWHDAEKRGQGEAENLLIWVFYQNLHAIAMEKYRKGLLLMQLDDLHEHSVMDQFRLAIKSDGYENLGL